MGADCVVSSCSLCVSPGLCELLCALPSQLQPHVHSQDDSTFLHNMFGERSLHSLVKVNLLYLFLFPPSSFKELCLSEELQGKSASEEISELLNLLAKPHVKSLLSVHDTVAQKSYDPELPPLPDDIDDDEVSVKIIRLVKNKEPLVSPPHNSRHNDNRFPVFFNDQ
uniref:L27 domain-containing protein n=1 Tax=Salmo trutta TaxID=8032 RepID=A0A673VQQ7_SALTR